MLDTIPLWFALQAPPAAVSLPHEILYTIIGILFLLLVSAVSLFGGLWIRSHDTYRQWSTERINAHENGLAVLRSDFTAIHDDLGEIKKMLDAHTQHDARVHEALILKLGLIVKD